jgi:predicted DNA-binding protein
MALNTAEICIHLPPKLKAQLQAVSWSCGMTVGQYVREALRAELSRQGQLAVTVAQWETEGKPNDYRRGKKQDAAP